MSYLKSLFLLCFLFCASVVCADELVKDSKIKIGSILILTGEGAAWGTASKNGIDLAIEDVNANKDRNGFSLEAIHNDDKGSPKEAIAAFRKLTDVDAVSFIIGPNWSSMGDALAPLVPRSKAIVVSPSLGVARFNESHPRIFNTWPHDEILSKELANIVYDDGHRKVALIGAEEVWVKDQTLAFKKQFEARGGVVSYLAEPLPSTRDVKVHALKISRLKEVDAFVSTTDGVIIGSLVAKSLMELGVKLPKYSITLDQSAIDAAQGGFEGLKFLTSLTPTDEFKKRYEERFAVPIDIGAASSYTAVMMIAKALKAGKGLEGIDVVADRINAIESFNGASGNLKSDGKGGFEKPFVLMQVKDGKGAVVR